MNKSELIEAIAASADIPKAAATRALDAMIESVSDSLAYEIYASMRSMCADIGLRRSYIFGEFIIVVDMVRQCR